MYQQRNVKPAIWTLLLTILSLPTVWSQGWERTLGDAATNRLEDVVQTPDGGFLSVGSTLQPLLSDTNIFLVKTDADGNLLWSKTIGTDSTDEQGHSIIAVPGGKFAIGGSLKNNASEHGLVVLTDMFGTPIWTQESNEDSVQGRGIALAADGGFALVGRSRFWDNDGNDHGNWQYYMMRLDSLGAQQWFKTYGNVAYSEDATAVVCMQNTDFLATGYSNNGSTYEVISWRVDASGNHKTFLPYPSSNLRTGNDIIRTNDGNFVIVGESTPANSSNSDIFLLKIDTLQALFWSNTIGQAALYQSGNSLAATPDGGLIVSGNSKTGLFSESRALLIKTDLLGIEQWSKSFGGNGNEFGKGVAAAYNGGYVFAGSTFSFGAGAEDGYLVRTDNSGLSLSNVIRGNIHSNLNATCLPDNVGQNIANYLVEVAGSNTAWYGTSNEEGNYEIHVPEGAYNVRVLNPSPYWVACEDSVDVGLSGTFDTAVVNFSLFANGECPLMQVDMATLGLRRCFGNAYSIRYGNLGTQVANPATVEIQFDPWLVVDSASIPWTAQNGNTFSFNVGQLAPFEWGEFKVFVTVDCSAVLGQTHCSDALITPDSTCLPPNPGWDGASIQLSAQCSGNNVLFTIHNIGIGDMDEPQGYIVIEDLIIPYSSGTGAFQLPGGADTTIVLPADGSTFRMEAEQSIGHPGNSRPSITVEGCGGMSTGFVVDYPLNDAALTMDTDCQENTSSFDPNDKQGFPTGYGESHFIQPNTDLEYLIRFQNTGTDTAFTVVVRDTLSPFLDFQSILPGAGSHSYRFELYGNGIVKFTFEHILLPDSNVNEALSHGFVKFRICQKRDNPVGSTIENEAAIYFDYNEPVITNQVHHQVAVDFVQHETLGSEEEGNAAQSQVQVFPNPADHAVTIVVKSDESALRFSLFDSQGVLVRQGNFDPSGYRLLRRGLPSGMYLFRVETVKGDFIGGSKLFFR